ncbi:MAG TPA: RidA family protein [Steroidobacteraceae bacterium]|nr:RidA family protein [Steroidobacteraceae bacterium]
MALARVPRRLEPADHWCWNMPVAMSQGWQVGRVVVVGGQMSADAHGNILGKGDIETQTHNVFRNIGKVLAEAGADWRHVIKLNTYYVFDGQGDEVTRFWERMTRVRMEYLVAPGPAATAVRVAGLIYPDALIEAEAIAVLPE